MDVEAGTTTTSFDDRNDWKADPKSRKRRSESTNPLALARTRVFGGSGSSKRDKKAELLWHRKTGAGYDLFVQYYARQPLGIAVAIDSASSPEIEQQKTREKSQGIRKIHGGLSRASKRRKKKSGKQIEDCKECGPNDKEGSKTKDTPKFAESRLLQAMSKDHSHLFSFLEALSKPLPVTFRIREGIDQKRKDALKVKLSSFENLRHPILGDKRIYQGSPTTYIKTLTHSSPELKQFLNEHSMDGTIARQELGSMLPVLLLKKGGYIKPGMRVLDLCASPGSKTLQVAEIVGKTGRVRANDIHPERLETLTEAVERSRVEYATETIRYVNKDARMFPIPSSEKKLYDAVICDVPCSGDGTCRKDPHIIPNWSPNIGNTLHDMQVQILVRAMKCVRVDGIVSYSTCSLNPVEDEAVVAAALSRLSSINNEQYEILPAPHLQGLKLQHGATEWNVADYGDDYELDNDGESPTLRWHDSYEAALANAMANAKASMWPAARNNQGKMSVNQKTCYLRNCRRLLPQDHDTGGFFVAFIHRKW